MDRYIEQIMQDLEEAKKNAPPEPDFGDTYEEFANTMFALETNPGKPAKKIFGLGREDLPPSDKLNPAQLKKLYHAIVDTFTAFSCHISFPEQVPLKLRYDILRDEFADEVMHNPAFLNHYDFCTGWCPGCRILDFCDTKDDIWTEEELENERRKTERDNGNL